MKNNDKCLLTPTDLGDEARTKISQAINPLVADAFALYVKTKNYHWHMSGPHFRDYHLLLDEHAEQILNMIDALAERVRKIGGTTIRSIKHISQLQTISDDNDEIVQPLDMIRRLMEDNKSFTIYLRQAHEVCDEYNDIATASLIENFVDEAERRIWFLFEILN